MSSETVDLIRDLGMNAGLLAFLAGCFGVATTRSYSPDPDIRQSRDTFILVLGGLLFGGVGIASMAAPIAVAPGVILDTKTVVVALAAAYLPAWPAFLAILMMAAYRIHLGGVGMIPALAAIAMSAGVAFYLRSVRDTLDTRLGAERATWAVPLVLGVGVASAGLLGALFLPSQILGAVFPAMLLPVVIVYPLATMMTGYLMETGLRLRRREQQLSAALADSQKMASIFENSMDTIAVWQPDGTILDVNPAYCSALGYSREELVGSGSDHLRVDKDGAARFLRDVARRIEQSGRWQGEVARKRKNGEIFVSDITIQALPDPDGVVRRWVSIGRDLTEKRLMEEEVRKAGNFDPLSGLPNRRMVIESLRALLDRPAAHQTLRRHPDRAAPAEPTPENRNIAVCVFDIDDFKDLNDRYGYRTCDRLLRDVAIRLKEGANEHNIIGRLGGDEFVVVLTGFEEVHEALDRVYLIKDAIAEPLMISGNSVSLQSSVGVTLFPTDPSDADSLLRHADLAMYTAKDRGKNQIYVYDYERDRKSQQRRETIRRIDVAIDRGEMELFFQPKVRISDDKVIGAEALIRWRHPERGIISPAGFLDDIEGTPTAAKLDFWVLKEAIHIGGMWHASGSDLQVSVNMTVSTLTDPMFLQRTRELLRANRHLPSNFLEVELLETETLNDLTMVAYVMQELADTGVQCSIDDFGTGYSSLTYLQRLPAQIIKIDQSFVRDMLEDERDMALVKGIIGLAKAFNRQVVAEGVETAAHALHLKELGCDILQGYGIARPMPASEMPGWLENWKGLDALIDGSGRIDIHFV